MAIEVLDRRRSPADVPHRGAAQVAAVAGLARPALASSLRGRLGRLGGGAAPWWPSRRPRYPATSWMSALVVADQAADRVRGRRWCCGAGRAGRDERAVVGVSANTFDQATARRGPGSSTCCRPGCRRWWPASALGELGCRGGAEPWLRPASSTRPTLTPTSRLAVSRRPKSVHLDPWPSAPKQVLAGSRGGRRPARRTDGRWPAARGASWDYQSVPNIRREESVAGANTPGHRDRGRRLRPQPAARLARVPRRVAAGVLQAPTGRLRHHPPATAGRRPRPAMPGGWSGRRSTMRCVANSIKPRRRILPRRGGGTLTRIVGAGEVVAADRGFQKARPASRCCWRRLRADVKLK